ncbi:hypothetical protein N9544_02255 [Flavobacteriales bacterium]|nr:hypothetical protein [Flavobacteriales bacterium]
MKYEEITNVLSSDKVEYLNSILKKGIITEKQLVRMFISSFNYNEDSGEVETNILASKSLVLFEFILGTKLKSKSPKAHKELIKRLMSKNGGVETANEIYTHIALSKFIKNYVISKLFDEGNDGNIIDKKIVIPIEIKSRIPKFFELIFTFFSELSELYPVVDKLDLSITYNFRKICKSISQSELNEEMLKIKAFNNRVNLLSIPPIPILYTSKNDNIDFDIIILNQPSTSTNYFGLSKENLDKCIYETISSKIRESGFESKTYLSVTLSDGLKNEMSKTMIKECIKRIKNMPKEPCIIAIYSEYFNDSYLKNFFNEISEKYIQTHLGTCILGISAQFHETGKYSMSAPVISIGKNLKPTLSQYIKFPN